jgi:hypothetical protein
MPTTAKQDHRCARVSTNVYMKRRSVNGMLHLIPEFQYSITTIMVLSCLACLHKRSRGSVHPSGLAVPASLMVALEAFGMWFRGGDATLQQWQGCHSVDMSDDARNLGLTEQHARRGVAPPELLSPEMEGYPQ